MSTTLFICLGTVMKILRSERIRKSPELPSPSEVKVPSKESTTISQSSETKWQNNGGKKISSLENRIFHQNDLRETAKREKFASLTTQHLQNRREIDAISESKVGLTECANFTFNIKYEDIYKVWNNFSMMYQSRMYRYNEYRVTDDGLQVCNSSDPFIQQKWQNFIAREKKMTVFTHCNVSVDGFYFGNYTLFKNFTVFFHPTEQNFTRRDYGVIFRHFAICSAKLSLSCNDDLIKVKDGEQYNVFKNFSLFYNNTMYDYREYRFSHDSLEMCASNDSRVQALWKTRNSWEKFKDLYKCRGSVKKIHARYYTVNKQFTVYLAPTARSQYFTRNNYGVTDGKPYIREEKFEPMAMSRKNTQDLSMCKDSIINIKYDDEYKVWNDFSILYKNKVYDYTEYRVLSDSIKICNSTDNYVRNIWKEGNTWVNEIMYYKSCNLPIEVVVIRREVYTVRKDFSVLILPTDQVIAKYDYGVHEGYLILCKEKILYLITSIRPVVVAPLCAIALSIISLLLLLIVYCMLPELRTLPGLNLMSLSFAFLLWLTCLVVFMSQHLRVGKLFKIACDKLVVTSKFLIHSILMNAAVNIFHLRKTFCGNTLVKSDENKWKTFLKYSVFSWGVPLIITIVYIVLVKKDVLRYYQKDIRCFSGHEFPLWLAVMDEYGLVGCLLLYIIVMFSFTAYRIRQKLKASSSIAQKSNIVKKRNIFVLLLKLSTTAAISFFPLLFQRFMLRLNVYIQITLLTAVYLSGFYIGIAFVFTKRNYRLLKQKYFPAKKKSVNA
jgi:hypothetical protein